MAYRAGFCILYLIASKFIPAVEEIADSWSLKFMPRCNLSTYVNISTYTGDMAAAFEQSKAHVPAVKSPPDVLGRDKD